MRGWFDIIVIGAILIYIIQMDRKIASSVSSTDSFFFQLHPRYLRVDHGFAKTIKPNTSYRLSVFKGIQKADEMSQTIKGKLVGGKIIIDSTTLNFYLPIYTPTRSIQFTVKLLETKPNELEAEIASHKIKSGDFVKLFKNEGVTAHHEQATLLQNLVLVFDLFVHNSKMELDKIVKQQNQKQRAESRGNIAQGRGKTPRKNEISSQVHSGSEALSETGSANREGGMFASKKKLNRRRGHDGKMKSKHGSESRENSEVGSDRSRSSRKSFGPFPHNEQNQHFVHSPKKVSPPKVDEDQVKGGKDNKGAKGQNLVAVGRKDSQHSEFKNYGLINTTPTKIAKVESNIQRSESTKRIGRVNNNPDIKTPITSRKEPAKVSPKVSPKANDVHDLEINTKQNLFEIQRKQNVKSPEIKKPESRAPQRPESKVPEKVENKAQEKTQGKAPQRAVVPPSGKTNFPNRIGAQNSPQKGQAPKQSQSLPGGEKEPISKPSKATEVSKKSPNAQKQQQPSVAVKQGNGDNKETESKKGAAASEKSKDSKKVLPTVQTRHKPVVEQNQHNKGEIKMKTSVRLTDVKTEGDIQQAANQEYQGIKDKLFYVLFTIVSLILFWNAITPTRRV